DVSRPGDREFTLTAPQRQPLDSSESTVEVAGGAFADEDAPVLHGGDALVCGMQSAGERHAGEHVVGVAFAGRFGESERAEEEFGVAAVRLHDRWFLVADGLHPEWVVGAGVGHGAAGERGPQVGAAVVGGAGDVVVGGDGVVVGAVSGRLGGGAVAAGDDVGDGAGVGGEGGGHGPSLVVGCWGFSRRDVAYYTSKALGNVNTNQNRPPDPAIQPPERAADPPSEPSSDADPPTPTPPQAETAPHARVSGCCAAHPRRTSSSAGHPTVRPEVAAPARRYGPPRARAWSPRG